MAEIAIYEDNFPVGTTKRVDPEYTKCISCGSSHLVRSGVTIWVCRECGERKE